jgi:hypothetical protein
VWMGPGFFYAYQLDSCHFSGPGRISKNHQSDMCCGNGCAGSGIPRRLCYG